ncbi:MAG: hypothetical protein ACOZBZ_00455 [Patescibacteria group bacterium]
MADGALFPKTLLAHTIASIRKFLARVNLAFSFEIKDDPSPEGEKYWERWGISPHQTQGTEKKSRYFAFEFLNQMGGEPPLKKLSIPPTLSPKLS